MIAGPPDNKDSYYCSDVAGISIYYPKDGIYQGDMLKIDFADCGHGKQLTIEGLITVPGITEYYSDKIKNKSMYLERNIKLAREKTTKNITEEAE